MEVLVKNYVFLVDSARLVKKNMYGLILENLAEYIRQVYGEDRWEEIRRQASVDQPSFSVHQVYPENLIPRLAKKAIQVCLRRIISFLIIFRIYIPEYLGFGRKLYAFQKVKRVFQI